MEESRKKREGPSPIEVSVPERSHWADDKKHIPSGLLYLCQWEREQVVEYLRGFGLHAARLNFMLRVSRLSKPCRGQEGKTRITAAWLLAPASQSSSSLHPESIIYVVKNRREFNGEISSVVSQLKQCFVQLPDAQLDVIIINNKRPAQGSTGPPLKSEFFRHNASSFFFVLLMIVDLN